MHDVETRTIQTLLDQIEREDDLGPQTMAHIKHLLGGFFHFAIAQDHLPKGTINPVMFAETAAVPDFRRRAYSLEENRIDDYGIAGTIKNSRSHGGIHRAPGR
jgi:hypothetical protein